MTHKWSNSSWWSKTATLAAFRKQCRHINSKLCQLLKKKSSSSLHFSPRGCFNQKKKVLMNESFIQCELLTASQIRRSNLFATCWDQLLRCPRYGPLPSSRPAWSGKIPATPERWNHLPLDFDDLSSNTLDWGHNKQRARSNNNAIFCFLCCESDVLGQQEEKSTCRWMSSTVFPHFI